MSEKEDSEIDFHKVPFLPFYFDTTILVFYPIDIQTSVRMILFPFLLMVLFCQTISILKDYHLQLIPFGSVLSIFQDSARQARQEKRESSSSFFST